MRHFTLLILLAGIVCGCSDYNHDKADTPANKKGFAKHLGQQPPADVKGIFFYADEMGGDSSYQFRFECSQQTHDALVQSLSLTNASKKEGHLQGRDFPWWEAKAMDTLPVHWKDNGKGDYFWFLWYDSTKSEAFFLEYSL